MSKKLTAGERLWLEVYRADEYRAVASRIEAPPRTARRMSPELATQRWLTGIAQNLEETFARKLRSAREETGLTQQQVAEKALLSVTGLAMIERGERLPGLDTATRICWALDELAKATAESA